MNAANTETRRLIAADLRLVRRDRGTLRVSIGCSACQQAESLSRVCSGEFERATMAVLRTLHNKGWRISLLTKSPLCSTCASTSDPLKERAAASAPSTRPAASDPKMNATRLCIYCGTTYQATNPGASTVFCNDCTSELNEQQKSSMTILWAGASIRAGRDARIERGQSVHDPWPEGFPAKGGSV